MLDDLKSARTSGPEGSLRILLLPRMFHLLRCHSTFHVLSSNNWVPCQILKEKYGTCYERSCAFWLQSTGKWWRLFRVLRQILTRFGGIVDGDGEEVDGVDDVDGVDGVWS